MFFIVLIMIGGGECLYDDGSDYKDNVNGIMLVVTRMVLVVKRTMW